jgi:thiamine biosynthesis protein ThiS
MTILINDEMKVVPDGATVSDVVLNILQLQPVGMAIAINDAIVHRTHWETRQLQSDDKMLVIKASKGG